MTLRKTSSLLAVILLFAPLPALSQARTAGALAKTCQTKSQAATCTAYIIGYIEGRNQSLGRPTICLQPSTSIADVATGFLQHLDKNRLDVNIEAGLVLGSYLLAAHPCKR
jgi:Rap1a immunity proteins